MAAAPQKITEVSVEGCWHCKYPPLTIHCPQLRRGKQQGCGGGGKAQSRAGISVGSKSRAGTGGEAAGRGGQANKKKSAPSSRSRFQQVKCGTPTITKSLQTATVVGSAVAAALTEVVEAAHKEGC